MTERTCTSCGGEDARTHIHADVLCDRCAADRIGERMGLPPVPDTPADEVVWGADGMRHRMRYRFSWTPTGPWVEAVEVDSPHGPDAGFQFRQVGTFDQGHDTVVEALRDREHREITRRYLDQDGHLRDLEVVGRVSWRDDDVEHGGPTLVIDGRPVSWTEFGQIMASHEGFEFRLRFDGEIHTTQQ